MKCALAFLHHHFLLIGSIVPRVLCKFCSWKFSNFFVSSGSVRRRFIPEVIIVPVGVLSVAGTRGTVNCVQADPEVR